MKRIILTRQENNSFHTVTLYEDWYEYHLREPGHVLMENWRYDEVNQTPEQVIQTFTSLGFCYNSEV